jgi:uncharacterized protein (DUF2267 family)
MDHRSFLMTVAQLTGASPDQVEDATCYTLDMLSQRISTGSVENIARRLPKELRGCLRHYGTVARFHLDDMIRRVEKRMGADRRTAQRVVFAVMVALRRQIGPAEFADLRAQLPGDFLLLLDAVEAEAPHRLKGEEPPFIGPLSPEKFLDGVAQRTGLDRDRARRAAEAVLEVLAMLVTAGQVADLRPYLPYELRLALDRGTARSGGRALPLSLDAFVEEIIQREGVSLHEAAAHARAVLDVLHEAVGDEEFRDTIAQLPRDYQTLLHR